MFLFCSFIEKNFTLVNHYVGQYAFGNEMSKKLKTKSEKKLNEMVRCSVCNTFVHESIVVKKSGKEYCSTECSNL